MPEIQSPLYVVRSEGRLRTVRSSISEEEFVRAAIPTGVLTAVGLLAGRTQSSGEFGSCDRMLEAPCETKWTWKACREC